MDYLKFLSGLNKARIERKTLEELLDKLIEEQKPSGYPTAVIQDVKVQSNHQQKSAETVCLEMQELINKLTIQKVMLKSSEAEGINFIYSQIKDPLERSFLINRFYLNKPVREMMRDFGMSKATFYRTFGKFFSRETNETK